jgi:hypothetical protein
LEATSHVWRTESNVRRKSVFAITVIAFSLSLVLAGVFMRIQVATTSGAVFVLFNALMMMVGVSLLLTAKQVVTVDDQLQTIVIETNGPIGRKVTKVSFNNVADVTVRHDGYNDEGTVRYYVAAKLKTGTELFLFRGFYDGNRDREAVEALCERIRRLLPPDA